MSFLIKGSKKLVSVVLLPLLVVGLITACGSDDDDEDTATATVVTFSDVSSIIEASCGGSDCHSSGAANAAYVGNETLVNSNAAALTTRIESTNTALVMPPTTSDKTLSDADKTTLLNYLSQQ